MKTLYYKVALRGVPDVSSKSVSKSVPGRVSSKRLLQECPA